MSQSSPTLDQLKAELGPKPNDWNGSVLWHQRRKEMAMRYKLPGPNDFRKDGTALFKIVGGTCHGVVVRSQFPYDPIVFPNGERYEYSDEPISRRSKAHVYKFTGTVCQP